MPKKTDIDVLAQAGAHGEVAVDLEDLRHVPLDHRHDPEHAHSVKSRVAVVEQIEFEKASKRIGLCGGDGQGSRHF